MTDAEPTARKGQPVSVRLPAEVKLAAERAARRETRSLSGLIEKVLTDHLKANGYLGGGPTGTLAGDPPIDAAAGRRS